MAVLVAAVITLLVTLLFMKLLMGDPKIIFGDEPTGALNSKAAGEIMELFTQINADATAILLVTHDPGIAAGSERVLFLCDGKIAGELNLPKFADRKPVPYLKTIKRKNAYTMKKNADMYGFAFFCYFYNSFVIK